MEADFLEAYSSGHRLYELESAAYAAQSRVDQANAELEALRRNLAASEAALVAADVSAEQRVQLALDIKDMAKRQGQIERELVELQRDADRRYAQLARYRNRLAYNP
jgi:septal ring factor EnvC (AmiA/AmiB activator)